jgi:hypothetical protein
MRVFLSVAGKCNLPGGGDRVKERACKKRQHGTTINEIPLTTTKQMGMVK